MAAFADNVYKSPTRGRISIEDILAQAASKSSDVPQNKSNSSSNQSPVLSRKESEERIKKNIKH